LNLGYDAPPESCGNGIREGLEACDDGNLIAGDGCSPDCVVETSNRTAYTGPGLKPPDNPSAGVTVTPECLAVSASGVAYVGWFSTTIGEGGGTSESISHVLADGTVASKLGFGLSTLHPNGYNTGGLTLFVSGEDLYGGGTESEWPAMSQSWLLVEEWASGAGSPSVVFQDPSTTTQVGGPGAEAWATQDFRTFFMSATGYEKGLRATVSATQSQLISLHTFPSLYFDRVHNRLLGTSGNDIVEADIADGGGPPTMFTLTAGTPGHMHGDTAGYLYVVCTTSGSTGPNPCDAGAAWIVDLTSGEGRPFLDNSVRVWDLDYDPSRNDVIILADDRLYRVSRNP
jgi:cysteine-rich repeat protein